MVSPRKPYFMTYIYPALKSDLNKFNKAIDSNAASRFYSLGVRDYAGLTHIETPSAEVAAYIEWCENNRPVGQNPCIVNRISKIFESAFKGFSMHKLNEQPFDSSILKQDIKYSKRIFNSIHAIYQKHHRQSAQLAKTLNTEKHDRAYVTSERIRMMKLFQSECFSVCSSASELASVIVDICYQRESIKQLAWDVCGEYFVEHLLEQNNGRIQFPVLSDNTECDFTFCGKPFIMRERYLEVGDYA